MNNSGFSLLEVIFTCLLVGAAATIGFASIREVAIQHALQAGCESLVSDLARARVAALAGNLPVKIVVRQDATAYSVLEPGDVPCWRELPKGVRFEAFPRTEVTFYSRGSATPAGTYQLGNTGGRIHVTVAPSGRTRWERTR